MAKVLRHFEFREPFGSKYPWGEWLDGRVWQLEQGKDFGCSVSGFVVQVHHAARRRGLRARVTTRPREVHRLKRTVVVLQVYSLDEESPAPSPRAEGQARKVS